MNGIETSFSPIRRETVISELKTKLVQGTILIKCKDDIYYIKRHFAEKACNSNIDFFSLSIQTNGIEFYMHNINTDDWNTIINDISNVYYLESFHNYKEQLYIHYLR